MLSYLFAKKVLSPFETTPELQKLVLNIKDLAAHESRLNVAAGEDAANPAYLKGKVLTQIMVRFRQHIEEYNHSRGANSAEAMLGLVVKFKRTMLTYFEPYRDVLGAPRNNYKKTAESLVSGTTFIGGIGVGVATSSFVMGAGGLIASNYLKIAVLHATSLDDKRSATIQMLETTEKIINDIQAALEFVNVERLVDRASADSSPFTCPITLDKMKNPVLCTLDGQLYEKEAIKKWLTENRTSPFNRKRLTDTQSPSDVIADSIVIREAILDLEKQYQELHARKAEEKAKSAPPKLQI